jgi:hypothetical protein
MRAKPGLAHLHAIKFLHHDKFLASRQLVPRHCASAHLKLCATETTFRLKYLDSAWCLRRVTQPPFIAGPLAPIQIVKI